MIRRLTPFVAAAMLSACQATATGVVTPGGSAAPSAAPSTASSAVPSAVPTERALTVPEGAAAVRPLVTVPVVAHPATIAVANGYVYVGCADTGTIHVLDAATDKVVKELLSTEGHSTTLGAFDDDAHVFALDGGKNTARVIDAKNGHAVVQTVALPGSPSYGVVSPDFAGAMVVMGTAAVSALITYDAADFAKGPTIKDFAVKPGDTRRSVGYDHDWAVVPNGDGSLALIDTKTGASTALVGAPSLGDVHMGVWGGVARQAIVAERRTDAVSLYAVPSGERTTITGLGKDIADLQGEENLRRAYVAMSGSNNLAVIDYDKKRLFGKVDTGRNPTSVAITEQLVAQASFRLKHEEDGNPREVWVGNQNDDTMTVVDANTLRVMAVVQVGKGPHHAQFVGPKAYIANEGDGTVTVVDRTPIK